MSIEEMISFLEVHIKRDTERNKIITALKAGQAMRDALTGPVLDYHIMFAARNAWDEATKEDK